MASPCNGAGTAAAVASQSSQLSDRRAGIAMDNISNLPHVDHVVLTSTSPQDSIIQDNASQIFIRACNGTFALNVNLRCDSVEQVQSIIQEREGILVKDQCLIHGVKPLRQGTFLRDYDALRDHSTIHVSLRVCGGHRTEEMTLGQFLNLWRRDLICSASIPGQQDPVTVLTELGASILHGVLSCVLSAHRVSLAYDGVCGVDDLWVCVHDHKGAGLVVSRVYVGCGVKPSPVDARGAGIRRDYRELRRVIDELFRSSPSNLPLHVQSILTLLANLASLQSSALPPAKSTQLLRAYAVMVSSPVAVATMCVNLKRFYDQLEPSQKPVFQKAMETAQNKTEDLMKAVEAQPLFHKVYGYTPADAASGGSAAAGVDSRPTNQYKGTTGMELFNFSRNWFMHVPEERWPSSSGQEAGDFTGLHQLDYIFTRHFSNFLTEALLQLYKNFDDCDLITRVLIPFA
ncbi:unnamed protein product [Urochloa decumbens]|uniref:Ubiquitin-like domain-containing protein n=1 Tax=Urochloa decumbens TaxID=240449 RepID=A0ABC8YEK0_9POAL